jgi:hypothetical protein
LDEVVDEVQCLFVQFNALIKVLWLPLLLKSSEE